MGKRNGLKRCPSSAKAPYKKQIIPLLTLAFWTWREGEKTMQIWEWADAGYIDGPVPDIGGKMLFFGDFGNQRGTHYGRHLTNLNRKLLFVGVKRVDIRKRFDFVGSFESRQTGIEKTCKHCSK